ncbi:MULTISPECIES: alpha/beta hydrolase [unclassified Bradyrhizobium]|uniref:alpha/beta hydrolase n=1 Tax=unclassified Bradyrhizobium TaxID=2631580 RepID=UPI00140CE76B|nr:alpha/beta fold hydrolase [Bradyrhizobium sp. 2S1]MCK7673749.1 alpha/beta hydrolase [Bradyrhizobium sp. 2S1]
MSLPDIATEEMMVPSDTDGISLFVRNKRRADLARFTPGNTILFVAGSTYPASTSFDLRLDGVSWMDHLAARGHDVYLVDVRGYGSSTRPPEMALPASVNAPIVRTPVAVRDIGSVVAFIRARRNLAKINLIGWSWGTTLMSRYTNENPDAVARLVLIAPQWLRDTPSLADAGGPLGAFRIVDRSAAKDRWLNGVPADKRQALLPDHWFDAWADATFACGQAGPGPSQLMAPNGTVIDSREFWAAGKPLYDPARLTVPVLIVHGEWDRDCPLEMSRAVFGQLTAAPYRRWVEIGEATHSLFLESNRWQVFGAVDQFLEQSPPDRLSHERNQFF